MPHETSLQPQLSELMARYLNRQAEAQRDGLAALDTRSEVLPFDVGPVQPVDPALAWQAATAAVPFLAANADLRSWKAPPDWPQLVAAQEPAVAIAFCIGNYPQLLRNLHLILHKSNLRDLVPAGGRALPVGGVEEFAARATAAAKFPAILLGLGCLRLARHFDAATHYAQKHEANVPEEWRAAWANEQAALTWHSGKSEEAHRQWQAQAPTVSVLFNRGMAALFLGKTDEARRHLTEAIEQLPEPGAWHHLGRLYLALAR